MTCLLKILKSFSARNQFARSYINTENQNQPIFLVGFMAAGKTTVGRELASALAFDFVDLDEYIEKQMGKRVWEIFAEMGEAHFRQLERQAIAESRNWQKTIVALGGGAYIDDQNRAMLREIGKTIWLDCPLEVCLSRIAQDGSRPLAKSHEEMRELLEKRIPAYTQSDLRISVDSKSVEEIIVEIRAILRG